MEVSDFILSHRGGPQPLTAGQALARHQARAGRDEQDVKPLAEQAEDNALRHLAAGYQPGLISALSQQLGDTVAELETERAKIEQGQRRQAQVMRMHEAGRIGALDVPGMLDGDFGDPGRVERLEQRAESLRRQLAGASELTGAVAQRARQDSEDPVERAARVAHETFREATRQMMADAEAGRRPLPERRPFVSRGGAVSADVCAHCHRFGVTAGESRRLHERERAEYAAYAENSVITTGYDVIRGVDDAIVSVR